MTYENAKPVKPELMSLQASLMDRSGMVADLHSVDSAFILSTIQIQIEPATKKTIIENLLDNLIGG